MNDSASTKLLDLAVSSAPARTIPIHIQDLNKVIVLEDKGEAAAKDKPFVVFLAKPACHHCLLVASSPPIMLPGDSAGA